MDYALMTPRYLIRRSENDIILNARDDVRSSFYLEDIATEFDIQGLELDWVGG